MGAYYAETGSAKSAGLITGLNKPIGIAVLGKTLFVAVNPGGIGSVGTYRSDKNANFITNLISPYGLAAHPQR